MIRKAIVVDNGDPLNLGRIRAVDDGDTSYTYRDRLPWIAPLTLAGGVTDSGSFIIPDVGAFVYLIRVDDLFNTEVYLGGGMTKETKPVEGTVDVKVIYKSITGHTIQVCDTQGLEKIQIIDRLGQKIEMCSPAASKTPPRGTAVTGDGTFDSSHAEEQESSISITDLGGNKITLSTKGDVTDIIIHSPKGSVKVNTEKLVVNEGEAQVLDNFEIPYCRFTGQKFQGNMFVRVPSGEEE